MARLTVTAFAAVAFLGVVPSHAQSPARPTAGTPPAASPTIPVTPSTNAKTIVNSGSPAAPTNAVFPTAVNQKYLQGPVGKAREKTCLDQYNANKATNANGGLKWTENGGGYYSQCNARLRATLRIQTPEYR